MKDIDNVERVRHELESIKVIVPRSSLVRRGIHLQLAAFDWAVTVGERCREKRDVPKPLPWLLEHLTDEQKSLKWQAFCDPIPEVKPLSNQKSLF